MAKSSLMKPVQEASVTTAKELTNWAMDESRQRLTAATGQSHLRVFLVDDPVTVFVRGIRCTVNIHYHALDQVEIHAQLYHAFGLKFVTEQDEAGVYVVVKRRRLLGLISRAEFMLKVPNYANLAFNLTPGSVKVDQINGILEVPPPRQHIPSSIHQVASSSYNRTDIQKT